jgi:hypothetical protein
MVSKQESQVIKKIIFKFNSYQNYLHETSAMISITHPKAPQKMFLIPEEEPSEAFSAPKVPVLKSAKYNNYLL